MADKLPSGPKVSGMDIVDAFLSKMKTETKQDGGTIEYNIKVEGTNELQKANELIEKFHKLNKQNKGNYFTSEAKGLENVTDAFEKYTKAQSEYDKKIARGDLVRWTNAYKARDDFDQSKISQQVLDTASEAEKVLNGSSGRGYIHYSVDSFRELFSVMKEMQDTGYYDMGQFSKNFNAIPKAAKDAASQARKQMEQTPIITEDMIINSDQVKARISELETSISDFYNRYQKEAELIKKGEARQYIKNLQELEDLYSLTNSDKYIDDKFFDLQDNQIMADYPGINMERIKKEVNTSINQLKKSVKNSLSGEMRSSSGQTADDFTQTGEAASTATTQVNEFNEAVNRGNESPKQSGVAESFTEAGQAAEEATEKIEKFDQTARGKQNKSFMTEQEQARISEEYKATESRMGAKAGNIDQLREQYKYLTMINESIKSWNENKTGIYGPLQDSLENLRKYKAELLENNPQLQSVSDHMKGNKLLGGDFKRKFAEFFPSFDALEEMYDHITALQQAAQDATKEAKPTYVKKLNEQRKAFVDMYEAYNEMTNGKMDVDVPGKKNITDMRNMYIALKDGLKATQETVHDSGAATGTPQFVETADAVGQAAESATEKVRELNTEMQNTSSSTTSEAVAGVSKEFEELETAINNTQNKYAQAIFNKSFTTKNKTAAQAQLKENYLAMQDILEADDWNNLSQIGEVAAYNYLKSFQEAVQKGARPQMLEKYTIDAFKTFDGESYLYDRYSKNTSEEFDLQLEDRIAKLKAFTSIMDEMKTKYPDADLSKRSEVSGKNMLNEMLEYANIFNRIRSNKTDDTGLFDFKYFEDELKSQKEYIDGMLKTDQIFRERDKFNKYMPKGDDFNDPQTYIQVSEKYDSLATEISNGSKTAEQAIAELNAEIEKLNGTTSQAEAGQSRADALNAEAEAARNDADAQRELATAKKEADSQVSSRQPTAMSDATKELRKVWYHGTNETFDEFDVSKNEQATYGAGGYLTDDKKMAQTYGKNVMEFFADISNAYVEGSELSKDQIQKVWDEYGQYLGELQNSNKFKNLSQISKFDVSTIEGFGDFLNNPKTSTQFILNSLAKAKDKSLTSTDIFKSLGYDSYYYPKNDILNIFDSKNIIKATDEVKNSLQQYGDVRREVAQASASAPGGSEQAEQFEQEAKAAKQATDAEKELASARKETTPQTAGQSPISSEVSVLDKKVAELQYLHDKVRTIFDGKDGIINEDMSYSEKFDSSEVQRMITLLSQLSDAELQATMGIDGEEWANEFRYNLQAEINTIKELQDELQKVQDGTSTEDAEELDIRINDRLEHIYEMAQNVTKSFDSSLTPSVKEFLSLIEDNLGISSMPEFMMGNAKEIDRYINDIIHNGKSVKEVFADMENRYGWDTARFDNLIDGNVPTELKGLYDSLFSDVENRIKSAEQAAEEFNAKLREFQSNETPVSEGTTTAPSPDKIDAETKAHEDAAEAAEKHAEAARQANEAEGQKPTQADTSNSEAQTQANEQEARSAQQAAEAEKERANAAKQANQTARQATATATSSENIGAEASTMESLQTAVTGVTEAVNAKTEAFSAEQSAVSSAIQAEIASLESLKQALSDIKQSVSDMGEAFNSIGKDNPFTSMFDNINKNAEALKNFADILRATKEQQEQATKAAEASKDRIVNEKAVNPDAWKEYIKNNKTLVDELGGIVDVREQTRVAEKSGEEYISYLLKGKTGSAIIGKNGRLLNKNILQSDDFSQHQQNVKDQYKDAIQAMKDYGKAVEELNQLRIDAIQDKPVDGDQITVALDRANEAAQRCIESLKTLDSLNKSGEISKRQYDEANRIASETQKKINDSNTKVKTASNNQEYQDQINIIQKAIEARNEYNKMLTNETKGYTTPTDQRDAIVSNLEATADAYKNAIERLKELQEEEKITAEQFNTADQMFGQGTKASQGALDKAYQDKIEKQVEKIQRYQTAANKAETTQNKFNVGDATAKQVQNAVDRMNELKAAAEEAMSVLEQMNKTEGSSKFIPDDTLNKYKQIMEQVKQMNGLFTTGDRTNAEFATIERGYQTLMKYADQYTRITEKQRNGEALSFNDLQFLTKYGSFYQDAANNAGLFEDAQNKAADSMKKFQETMNNSDTAAFNETLQKMGQTLAELGKGTWNKLGQEALEKLNTQYENLVKSTIDYKNSSKEVQAQMRSDAQSVVGGLGQFIDYKDQGYYTTAKEKSVAALDAKMATWQFNNSAATGAVQQIDKLRASLEGISPGRLEEVNAEFERIKASAASAGTLGKSFGDSLKKSFMGLGRYLATYTSFYRVIGTIKSAVNMVKELDSALMEVRKVSAKPLSELKEWQKGTFEQADEVGTTGKQLQQSTAAWLRLGKSFSESQEAAKASSWLLNVSEFKSIDDATTALVSMKQAYNDLSFEDIIDKLNNVGDHFSSATDQLASGLQNAGAVLKTQGNDIDKSLALLTAGNDITQDMSFT